MHRDVDGKVPFQLATSPCGIRERREITRVILTTIRCHVAAYPQSRSHSVRPESEKVAQKASDSHFERHIRVIIEGFRVNLEGFRVIIELETDSQCCWIPKGTGRPVKYIPALAARPRKFETRNLTKPRAWIMMDAMERPDGNRFLVYFSFFVLCIYIINYTAFLILLLFLSNNHFMTGPSSRSKSSTRHSTKIQCRNVLSSRITSRKFAIRNVPDRNQKRPRSLPMTKSTRSPRHVHIRAGKFTSSKLKRTMRTIT